MKSAIDVWAMVEGDNPTAKSITLTTGRAGGKTYRLMHSARNCAMRGDRVLVIVATANRTQYVKEQLLDLWPEEHHFPRLHEPNGNCVLFPGGGQVVFEYASARAFMNIGDPAMLCLDSREDFPTGWDYSASSSLRWLRTTRTGSRDSIEIDWDFDSGANPALVPA